MQSELGKPLIQSFLKIFSHGIHRRFRTMTLCGVARGIIRPSLGRARRWSDAAFLTPLHLCTRLNSDTSASGPASIIRLIRA
jgi:hypothetical protein